MKNITRFPALIAILLLNHGFCFAQANDEAEIRSVESQQTQAILKNDTTALYKLWSPDIVVNNPYNVVVTMDQIKKIFRSGKVGVVSSLDVAIEKITFIKGMAIVMGKETLTPTGASDYSGKTVVRRFTNIWTKDNSEWKLTARQATIISIN